MGLSKRAKRKRILPPRAKRMKRPARLQAARHWLLKYPGANILRGYCKYFAVDWRCAAVELRMLGVPLDEKYLQQRELTERELIRQRQRKKEAKQAEDDLAEAAERRWTAGMIEETDWADLWEPCESWDRADELSELSIDELPF